MRFRSLALHSNLPLILLGLFVFNAAQVPAQVSDEATLVGMVSVSNGDFPPRRIQINLETRGALIGITFCDNEGRFSFPNLRSDLYHVVVNDSDYVSVDESVSLHAGQMNLVQVRLVPKGEGAIAPNRPGANTHMMDNNSGQQSASSNVKGSNPYLVDLKEYASHFPKAALKEFDRGTENAHKGKLDDAIKHYKKAIELAPNFYPAHNDLGTAYLQKGDLPSAQTEFEAVVKANPSDASAYFNLANAALLSQRYEDGLGYVGQGLSKQPNSGTGLFIQGSLYRHLGRMPEAERSLRNSLQADPSLANAHLELVNLYRQQENRSAVVAELQAFLKLYPNNPIAPRVKDMLVKLGASPR